MTQSTELMELERSLAYESAVAAIEGMARDATELTAEPGDWFDVSECRNTIKDDLRYLELRGLLVIHPGNPDWVRPVDESEATA